MSVRLTDIVLTYPDGDATLRVLDGLDFHAGPGETVAVTGPSGSGKSSLLAVAGLLTVPDSGRVVLDGVDTAGLDAAARTRLRRERIGFVFQQANLLPSLTATEQLSLIAHLSGRRLDRARARDLLAAVGLTQQADRRPHQLSGGQRQRVAIARSLVNDPAVLLVDEPTSALDADRSREIVELLERMARERDVAVVLVTHDREALRAGTRLRVFALDKTPA
ncbi:ABC transporter ATP-binding protein [Rhodococcus sp. 14C212]|uniref:ABC transporter ATP-binding protein n=1 Tax=Rhodococcus sp. 14C212 TaxID=2711209 RepID=UPI0013E9B32B|nr:ABC transporter ATP-binding protein [Rhodococcus sp. 14C212]NGP05054.1 ABC transporter ATP-binding protein [Rhodococcus sp. 14C212]